jgi:hypothetical protein
MRPIAFGVAARVVVGEIAVVLLLIGRGHQHADVLVQHFVRRDPKIASAARLNKVTSPRLSMQMIASRAVSKMACHRRLVQFAARVGVRGPIVVHDGVSLTLIAEVPFRSGRTAFRSGATTSHETVRA